MNEVDLINNVDKEIEELKEVKKFISFALNYLNLDNVIFNVIIVDNLEIHRINKEYRNMDKPTDVISFALEDDDTFIKTEKRILGDIYISIDKAREQASEYGHNLLRELCFLTIHGILHLLGYDHMEKADEEIMFGLQERILSEYGIKR